MKTIRLFLLGLLLLVAPATQAQFTFTTNNGAITITGYTGSGGVAVIPASTNGYPITSIGDYAFSHSGVTSVTIGANITSIGIEAFDDCTGLTSITIPNNVTSIADGAFFACFSLTTITIPSSVTNLGAAPFDACPMAAINVAAGNPAFTSVGGVLFNQGQTKLIEYPGGSASTFYIIPTGVTDIAESAFQNCSGLTNIVIPDSVTNLEASAFLNCNSLTSITIPSSVTTIGSSGGGAFEDCTSLAQVYFLGNAPSAGSYVFEFDDNLTAVYYLPGTTGWGATFSGVPAVELVDFTITVSASPSAGGSVSGGGSFAEGSSQTVTASANSGYTFANWTESGIAVSPSTNYVFTLSGNVNLVANFSANPVTYSVTVSASPGGGGTVAGGGTFVSGTSQTVTATASSGDTFANWTENGNVVSSSASYTFTLGSSRNLVANFIASPFVMYDAPGNDSFGAIESISSSGAVNTVVLYFGAPSGLAVDKSGNIFAAAGSVFKITPAGVTTTFGSGFSGATGVAFDPGGNLYVADLSNGTVSKVTPSGAVSVLASGFPSAAAGGNETLSLACDENGNVYLADYGSGIVWKSEYHIFTLISYLVLSLILPMFSMV